MSVLTLPRDLLRYSAIPSRAFSLRVSGAYTAQSSATVVLDTISKTGLQYEGDQPRLDQAWFWSPAWQAMEREADDDLAAGRYEDFDTFDDFIESLEELIEE